MDCYLSNALYYYIYGFIILLYGFIEWILLEICDFKAIYNSIKSAPPPNPKKLWALESRKKKMLGSFL